MTGSFSNRMIKTLHTAPLIPGATMTKYKNVCKYVYFY